MCGQPPDTASMNLLGPSFSISCVMESLIACKRAGADAILTYFARDAAKLLRGTASS